MGVTLQETGHLTAKGLRSAVSRSVPERPSEGCAIFGHQFLKTCFVAYPVFVPFRERSQVVEPRRLPGISRGDGA